MTTAASAMAYVVPLDVPIGWSQPDDVNMVHALLLLVGVPLLLFILITVAVYLPSIIRGERIAQGQPRWRTSGWAGRAPAPPAGGGQESEDAEAGGASGRW